MKNTQSKPIYKFINKSLYFDVPLLSLLLLLICLGLFILYSASNENLNMLSRQAFRLGLATTVMLMLACVPPHKYKTITPWIYCSGVLLLLAVMLMGKIGKGAQRWLDLGGFRFQPSEIMKLAVPMMAAWYLENKSTEENLRTYIITALIIFIPAGLIAKQPDLGTAIMVAVAGLCVIFVAGIPFKLICYVTLPIIMSTPILWHFLHDYQKKRIFTLINPEQDPLGSGYHIIQSKIAIGSGGAFGKGWLVGSQAHLNFLPEHATDFIFAVSGEELGFVGSTILILIVTLVALRCLHIAKRADTNYAKLLASGLSMAFFLSAFVNMGMVMGVLPVVGIPLPLVSYGGSAMLTFLASFGILMSISSHKIAFK